MARYQPSPPHWVENAYVFPLAWHNSPSSQNHRRGSNVAPVAFAFAVARVLNSGASTVPSTEYQTRFGRQLKRPESSSGLTALSQRCLQIRKIAFRFHIEGCCSISIRISKRVKSTPLARDSRS